MTIDQSKDIIREFIKSMKQTYITDENPTVPVTSQLIEAFSEFSKTYGLDRQPLIEYPLNVIRKIGLVGYSNLNNDQIRAFEYICEQYLTVNEYKTIQLRYKEELSNIKTSQCLHISKQRVSQLEHKALQKLSKIMLDYRFNLSYSYIIKKQQLNKTYSEDLDKLVQKINKIKNCKTVIENITLKDEDSISVEDAIQVKQALSNTIEDLDIELDKLMLSTRTYNTLKRAGFTNIRHFIGLTYNDLRNIRLLGNKGLTEIVCKLSNFGITIKEQRNKKEKGR